MPEHTYPITDNVVEQARKIVDEYDKDPPFGVEADKLRVFVKGVRDGKPIYWSFKETLYTKSMRDHILEINETYYKNMEKIEAESDLDVPKIQEGERAAKEILNAALEDFDFDKEADNPNVGVGALVRLSLELYVFLGAKGGVAGERFLQMQSSSILLNHYILSKGAGNGTRPSTTTQQVSARSRKRTK